MSSSRWQRARRPAAEKPLRDELLSIERLEERALALAASLTVDPNPRHRARDTFPRFEDNVRVLRAAYRTLADDVRTGQFVVPAADWLLDNFHLITAEITDIRRNLPRTYSRTLPTLASREHAGHARVYAIAVELIRHSDSRLDRQQLIAVPEQLSARRAADDRRAVGVAEHAEARAHREPAPAGRGAAVGTRRAPRRRPLRVEGGRRRAASARCPPATEPAFIVQLLHRVREYGLRPVGGPRRRRRRPRVAADDGRGRRFAASTSGRAWRRCRWPTPSRACACARRSTGRSTSSRSASSSRCCSAIRPAPTGAWTS